MKQRNVSILGTGCYLPRRRLTAEDLEKTFGVESDTLRRKHKVATRYYVDGETAAYMGAAAARHAIENAGLALKDIDVIVAAAGVSDQLIPNNAALVQRELGPPAAGIPSFDINSTCLSFVTAFDVVATLLDAGHYRTALIVSADIASVGIDWKHPDTACLFSDAAAAAVLAAAPPGPGPRVLLSRMETYAEGAHFCEIPAGGTRLYGTHYAPERHQEFLFRMDGPKVFKMAYRTLPVLIDRMFAGTGQAMESVDLVIPHQASHMGMEGARRLLGIPPGKWKSVFETHGNCIAASVPLALHLAIEQKELVRGQRCMLLGTAAGFSCGAVVFDY